MTDRNSITICVNQNDDKTRRMAQKEREAKEVKPMEVNNGSQNDLVDMLAKHRSETVRKNSLNHHKHHLAELEIGRDNFQRTASMLSYLSGVEDDEVMTNTYKYVTTGVLWFCYFSLVCQTY